MVEVCRTRFMSKNDKINVLIVDDDPEIRFLYSQWFNASAYKDTYSFIFCPTDSKAIDVVKEANDLCAIVCDWSVPTRGGLELVKCVKNIDASISCIIVSTFGNISYVREAMTAGAFDFLVRPTDFNDLERSLARGVDACLERRVANENALRLQGIRAELNSSADLQRSILPGTMLRSRCVDLFADTTPAAEVGGDFYDFFWITESRLGVVMADVSGKNVTAALFMAMAKTLIKAFASSSDTPADCLKAANCELSRENHNSMFVTAVFGVFDIETCVFEYSNAGHLPVVLVGSDGARLLQCDSGLALGLVDDIDFQNNKVQLYSGDAIFLYTDGVTEAVNANNDEFGYDIFLETLNDNKRKSPIRMTECVVNKLKEFVGGAEQSDDITTLCLKYKQKVNDAV